MTIDSRATLRYTGDSACNSASWRAICLIKPNSSVVDAVQPRSPAAASVEARVISAPESPSGFLSMSMCTRRYSEMNSITELSVCGFPGPMS